MRSKRGRGSGIVACVDCCGASAWGDWTRLGFCGVGGSLPPLYRPAERYTAPIRFGGGGVLDSFGDQRARVPGADDGLRNTVQVAYASPVDVEDDAELDDVVVPSRPPQEPASQQGPPPPLNQPLLKPEHAF
uniref:Uncharacterized protein n=1 Tax=Rhodosorus marinus TaxID=101924 RepID=A0A7S2ZX02_9RHOD|mmetsp:Transcript_33579/g.132487  ORF Transcript_33579/g.132487 Transcript_33579/m.132487 type:complete len:132 (+) Transcript_33579:1287-1682(+)